MITLRKGTYIVCPRGHVRTPPSECLPYEWLKSVQESKPFNFFDIDGYSINFRSEQCTGLFLKREYEFGAQTELEATAFLDAFDAQESQQDTTYRLDLARSLGVPLILALWPNDYPEQRPQMDVAPVWAFNLVDRSLLLNGTGTDLGQLIYKYRNYSFPNPKPLNAAKTFMECALSGTPNPWPGDLDCVVRETTSQRVTGLIEFKTHNLHTPIAQETQGQYAAQDARRFNVLGYMQRHLGSAQGHVPTLLFVVWGPRHDQIKVQSIMNGVVQSETVMPSPQGSSTAEQFYADITNLL